MKFPDKRLHWPILWEGVELIAQMEGCRLKAYKDVAGVWTLGWGETLDITEGMAWTQTEADRRLCARLTEFADGVRAALTRPALPTEFAAMVSLAYNIGAAAFKRSSVLKAHNRGDAAAAARAFHLWNKAGGKVISGLVKRRAREADLYLRDESNVPRLLISATPDADVGCEKRLAQSPTMISGAASIATGGLAFASQASPQVGQIARNLGVSPLLIVAVAAIVIGVAVIVRRYLQRKRGQA